MNKPKYELRPNGEFVIENYNLSKPLANFFPGIAGKYGIPMWVFYVNRAQGIASFGTKDKDHAIVEFFPADKSWQFTSHRGFRTFIKVKQAKEQFFYEPFQNGFTNRTFTLRNSMSMSISSLTLEEENLTLGLKVKVEYFTIPNENYAALARIIHLENTGKANLKLQLLDGLPQIIPFGTSNLFLKKLSRTIEAWMKVENLAKGVPFYKLDVDPIDRPEVIHIKEGNFYLGFHYENNKPKILKPIVNPQNIFGQNTDYAYPQVFLDTPDFMHPKDETISSKTPCGFLLLNALLKPKQSKTFYAVIGYMRNLEALNSSLAKITQKGYLARKREENTVLIDELTADVHTESALPKLDLYTKHTYLDNILRGGYPLVFKTKNSQSVFYLYSRKHGDLERDYNKFLIQPTYFSQGNGNYRDINQNRRCEVFFNPEIGDENLISFFNLLQPDGFNPLIVKGASYLLDDPEGFACALKKMLPRVKRDSFLELLKKPFTPGDIALFLEENKIKPQGGIDRFLNLLLSYSLKVQEAEHGEGFWTDHWHYNLDLLENYLAVYPEKLKKLLFEKRTFTFYDNAEVVADRQKKYLINHGHIQQLNSVVVDNAKKEMIKNRPLLPHLVRTAYGKGTVYQTTLINKLICLLVNKISSFDACGTGVEMEANKPNWFDALNGLPALFGSSSCEAFELKRLLLFLRNSLPVSGTDKIELSDEIHNFLIELDKAVDEYLKSNAPGKDLRYWNISYTLKEEYRTVTKFGFSGKEIAIHCTILTEIFERMLKKVDLSLSKAKDKNKPLYYAYFINRVIDYKDIAPGVVMPVTFLQEKLPPFLESQMHALRLSETPEEARAIHQATRKSALYDKKLKMYKVTAPLCDMPQEIGRCRAFTPGWLENESIWLHMEYKYLLELLKHGLYEEFYADFKNVLIPFQPPERYGRNILENSSFLASSAFPDKALHGNGFVARLSGSTIEYINIWLAMNTGVRPFFLNKKGELNLRFIPVLAGWLFDKKGHYSFNFLGKVQVVYRNPSKKDTFGKNATRIKKISFRDKANKQIEISGDTIPAPYAEQIRSRQIRHLDIYLT